MRKTLKTITVAIASAMLLGMSPASSAVFTFTFESFDSELRAAGKIVVDGAGEVTAVSGSISGLVGQTIASVAVNPNFPGAALSPDGSFIFNNVYHPSGMPFDIDGVLFVTTQNPGGYWNLWGVSPGVYALWESAGAQDYAVAESGKVSVAAVPELSTWAMLGLGFAGFGLAGRRRAPRLGEASLG